MVNKYQAFINELKLRQSESASTHRDSRVLIVDGLNTFLRSYAASPATNINGDHVGGISGFLLSVGHAIKAINPTRLVVVFDGKEGSAQRRALYPEYKANRKVKIRLNRSETVDKEDNQLFQLMRLIEYLEIMPVNTIVIDRTEADDVIAYLANDYLLNKDSHVFIMSSDKDFMQLVNQRVHVWSPTKKKMYYEQDVLDDFGIPPANFALFRALTGDDSDNISGVNGVGIKTLLERFPKIATEPFTVDSFIEYAKELSSTNKAKIYEKVIQSEEQLRLFYQIMQLDVSNINTTSKLRIMDLMDTPTKRLVKIQFHKMLLMDGMTSTIKNVDMWLRETTAKLDQYCLQD